MSTVIEISTANLPAVARGPASDALALARVGCALVPIRPRSKEPYYEQLPVVHGKPSWHPFALRAPSEAEILSWFARDPECGVAAIMGAASGGVVAIDVDHRDKLSNNLELPATVACTSSVESDGTWRGHLLYRASSPVATRRFAWGEVLGEGTLCILPPSIHPGGQRYSWVPGMGPDEVATAPAPSWVSAGEGTARVLDAEEPSDPPNPLEPPDPRTAGNYSERNIPPCYGSTLLHSLATNPEVALTIVRLCGGHVTGVGRGMRCVLPDHDDAHPSAALYQQSDGTIRYHDFHQADGVEWYSLGEVYAAYVTKHVRQLRSGERAIWHLRAATDAGLLRPPAIAAALLPDDAPKPARKLYAGFCRLLELRALYDGAQDSTPFSWRFAEAWCGIGSPPTVQKGMSWLLAHGYLERAAPQASEGAAGRRELTTFRLGHPT